MRSEVMAFADTFDIAFTIIHDLKIFFGYDIALNMMTDSLYLLDVLTEGSSRTE